MTRAAIHRLLIAGLLLLLSPKTYAQNETPSKEQTIQIGSVSVTLPEPTLSGETDEPQAVIESIIGGLSYRQFARDSVVAPVRIRLQYIKDGEGERVGQLVHVAMIAHVDMETLQSDSMMRRLFADSDTAEAESLSETELSSRGIDDASGDVQYHPVNFKLLDKVKLEGVIRVESTSSAERQRLDFRVDERFENRWQTEQADGEYRGFHGWLHTAQIEGGVVFIEARLAFAEPTSWFRGSNFLRSKLPLALQESAREFRRRLK
ncbi:MAG: hypothetical protein AAFX06_26550 [Planctomycetota bacterium]